METTMRFAQDNPDLYQLMFQRPVLDFVPSEESAGVSLAELQKVRGQFPPILESGELNTYLSFDIF